MEDAEAGPQASSPPQPEAAGRSRPPHVVVVGGGVAGMVAARQLAVGGARVTLLEASDVLGGKVASHTVAGILLDAGAESFATRRGTVAAFVAGLGLGDAVVQPNPAGAWLQPAVGAAVPLPKAGLLGIPGTPMAADVIAVIGRRAALRAQLDSLLGYAGYREHTLGGLVRRRMGRAVLEQLVAPVTMGVHSRHPDELELDVVAPGLRSAFLSTVSLAQAVQKLRSAAPAGSAVAGLDGGIFRLVETLEAKLVALGVVLRTGTRVDSVEVDRVVLGGGEVIAADRVVLACQLPRPSTSSGIEAAAPAETAGIVLATLVVRAPELDAAPRGTGLLVAAGADGIRAKALTHSTAKWPWLAARTGPGTHVLRLSYSAESAEELREELREQARADAERLLGVPLPASGILGFDRVEWARPAHSAKNAAKNPAKNPATDPGDATPDGVIVIGEAVAGTGLAAVIAQARQESDNLLTDLAH
jgi:oxygen-dependent protoporphyrinogen oxidase